jgi:hypothetical protein
LCFRKIPLKGSSVTDFYHSRETDVKSDQSFRLKIERNTRIQNTPWPELKEKHVMTGANCHTRACLRPPLEELACARPLRSSPAAPCRGAPCRPWRISSAPPPVGSLPRPALAGAYPRRSLRSSPAPARREAHRRRHVAVDARAGLGQSRPRRLP